MSGSSGSWRPQGVYVWGAKPGAPEDGRCADPAARPGLLPFPPASRLGGGGGGLGLTLRFLAPAGERRARGLPGLGSPTPALGGRVAAAGLWGGGLGAQ